MSSKRRDALYEKATRFATGCIVNSTDVSAFDRKPLERGYLAGYAAALKASKLAMRHLKTIEQVTREGELHANADLNAIAKEAIT